MFWFSWLFLDQALFFSLCIPLTFFLEALLTHPKDQEYSLREKYLTYPFIYGTDFVCFYKLCILCCITQEMIFAMMKSSTSCLQLLKSARSPFHSILLTFPYFNYSERFFLSPFLDFIKHIYQFHQGGESNTSSISVVILYPAALLFFSFLLVTCPEILLEVGLVMWFQILHVELCLR